MKTPISIAAGAAIILTAWGLTFGLPKMLRPSVATTDTAQSPRPAGGGMVAMMRRGGGNMPTVVKLAEIQTAPFVNTFRSIGSARPLAEVGVTAEVAGKVTILHIGANQAVRAGAPLVSLEDQLEQIALRSAQANLAEAHATLDRLQTLRRANSGAVSDVTVTEAETRAEIAEASHARAEYDLAQQIIRAPISGVLGLTDVEPGDYLQPNSAIVTISDQSVLPVEFGLPDRAVASLRLERGCGSAPCPCRGAFLTGSSPALTAISTAQPAPSRSGLRWTMRLGA